MKAGPEINNSHTRSQLNTELLRGNDNSVFLTTTYESEIIDVQE